MKKTRVILADDHAILRYGLKAYLSKTDDIQIVGEAGNGDECLQLFKEKEPDVCLIDIKMPGKNGIAAARAIRKLDARAKLIILSMYSDKKTMQKALKAGINGYIMKDKPKREIAEAIRRVNNGQQVINDASPLPVPQGNEAKRKLTNRELEILRMVVDGDSSPQIADKLFISSRTVDTHRNNMMQKLGLKNTASLVRFALQHNLIDDRQTDESYSDQQIT